MIRPDPITALRRTVSVVRAGQRGMTLIELMVALAIGLGVTLAVTTMLIAAENHKRTTTSVNDAEQSGAYAFYAVDRLLRGAGSAIAESGYPTDRGVMSCRLNVASIMPRGSAFPAPFQTTFLSGATNTLRVAPALIARNQSDQGSDVIVVMGGSGAAGGVPRQVTNGGGATSLILDNTVGFVVNDLVLVSQNGVPDCLVEQATAVTTPTLTLASAAPYHTVGSTTSLATLAGSTSSYVTPLGNAGANNMQFQLLGVGTNRVLYAYDLLQNLVLMSGATDASQAIADGVAEMHAIYGIDTNNDGIQDQWAGPGFPASDAAYAYATAMTNAATIHTIVSLRVALVLRSEYADKSQVSPTSLTLFSGLLNTAGNSLQQTVTLSANDQYYRYRVFEFTVPLRNMLLR